ncbi:PH domain-containing protein [Patulibacter defluvii]|uniref:PH domain-containing protein n=1 Tax=Patulibacter defluvii TaxID=3095358 RepID=UPI002A757A68|nr:PH domain-containing protein [Patulibacter sp. DM4]
MDLHADERVLYAESPSWRSQFTLHLGAVVAGILVGAIVFLAVDPDWIGILVGIGVVIAVVVFLWLERSRTKYVITTHRIHVREGLISKELQETRLDRIQNVTVNQTVAQRLLMIGTVDYDTAGDDGSRFRMEGVPRPQGLVRLVDNAQRAALEDERRKAAVAEAEADASVRSRYEQRGDGYERRYDDERPADDR